MTQIPNGAHLAPSDLPPPPPHADPREPAQPISRRGTRTPQRARSPAPVHNHHVGSSASRGASPSGRASEPPMPALGSGGDKEREGALASNVSSPILGAPIKGSSISPPFMPHHSSSSPTQAGFANLSQSGTVGTAGSAAAGPGGAGSTLSPHLSRPGSPASMHSSTSAIFERDIEVPAVHALSLGPGSGVGSHSHPGSGSDKSLSHRPSRLNLAHGSALDHTVPAVLDDAVEALGIGQEGKSRDIEGLEIESPAPAGGVGGLGGMSGSTGGLGGLGIGMARQHSPSFSAIAGIPGSRRGVSSPPLGALGLAQGASRSTSPAASLAPSGRSTGVTSPISIGGPALGPGGAGSPSMVAGLGQPGHSPPILAQLSTHGAGPSAGKTSETSSPIDLLKEEMNEVKREQEAEQAGASRNVREQAGDTMEGQGVQRPAPMTRMSTGKQVPGGWLSSWNDDSAITPTSTDRGKVNEDASASVPPPPAPTAAGVSSSARSPPKAQLSSAPISPSSLTFPASASSAPSGPSAPLLPSLPSHLAHLSPAKDRRRISFVSPTDLLLSVPTQVTNLGEITSGNAHPDHLPGTISPVHHRATSGGSHHGQGQAGGSPKMSTSGLPTEFGHGHGHADGEWEREGLGRGLEQRLEDLAARQ